MDFGNPDRRNMLTDKALSDRHTCEVTELGFNWPVIAVNVEISRWDIGSCKCEWDEKHLYKNSFNYLHFLESVSQHFSLLNPPSSHLLLRLAFHVPSYPSAEITYPEQHPTLKRRVLWSYCQIWIAPFLLIAKSPRCISIWLAEPGSADLTSSESEYRCLFQSLSNYRQFPCNYDILTADFDCSERRGRCKNYTR